jgi:hypothetical protein
VRLHVHMHACSLHDSSPDLTLPQHCWVSISICSLVRAGMVNSQLCWGV